MGGSFGIVSWKSSRVAEKAIIIVDNGADWVIMVGFTGSGE